VNFKVSNETKVGALTAVAITVLVLGYNFLKGKDLFTRTKTYYAIYESVDGLTKSNAVTINGYRIGQVSSVELLPQDSMKIKVTIEVVGNFEVREGSVAKIYNADFFGTKSIELLVSNTGTELESGSQLVSNKEASLVSSISEIAAPLKEKVEKLVVSLDSVFGGRSGQHLKSTITNIDNITKNFKNTSENLDAMIAQQSAKLDVIFNNVVSISNNLKQNNAAITATISNLKQVSDTIAALHIQQIVAKAESALQDVATITEKINKGEGSLGLLVNDKALYDNLQKSSASLDELLKDLKAHPKRYVHFSIFGKKDKK
jgi:phospholipid/cholesterol/gamma-HCH transport system substrate-binding protein